MPMLSRLLLTLMRLVTVAAASAAPIAWTLYLIAPAFPGRLAATVAFNVIIGRELWTSCLRAPRKVGVPPARDWTAAAVGLAYLGVLYACLAELHLRRAGFPRPAVTGAGLLLYLGGFWLRSSALRHLGEHWSIQLDQPGTLGELVRSGPYAWIRHPIYLGAILENLGIALFFAAPSALVIAASLFASAELARARFEERALTAKLGTTYRAYCEEVGGFFPQQLRRPRARSRVRRRP